jgi:hypothetical protein
LHAYATTRPRWLNMNHLLQEILASEDPSGPMEKAVEEGPVLRTLSQHIFYSFFSSYVKSDSATWTAQASETALQLLSEGKGIRYGRDWLLEIAFHGNLAQSNRKLFHNNIGCIEAAQHHLESEGPSRSSQYVKGLIAYSRDDLVTAENAFRTLAELHESPLLAYQAGYSAFRAPGFYRTLRNYEPEVPLSFIKEPHRPNEASIVLLCAVDDLYLAAFADDFVENALKVSPSALIHFHLVNNKVELSQLLETDLLSNDQISITVEHTEAYAPGIYAIMARYIILPFLLQRWGRPVLVTDIDLTLQEDPALLETDDAVTLCFSGHPAASYVPASAIIGHHNLFQSDAQGMEFAQILSRYLHYMCVNEKALWAADQVALLVVWRMLRNFVSVGDLRGIRAYSYGAPADRPQMKKTAETRLNDMAK